MGGSTTRSFSWRKGVLRTLRPLWGAIGDVILELQPHAWQFAGVTIDGGLRTLREFMLPSSRQRRSVITLPHARPEDKAASVATWHPCAVPTVDAPGHPVPKRLGPSKGGVNTAVRFGYRGLEAYLNNTLDDPLKYGWYSEVLLTTRCN